MRRAARVDRNHAEIVAACRLLGATVQSLAGEGKGVPDLLVGWRGANLLFEVKDGTKTKSQRRLTPDQVKWHAEWKGTVYVVECADDVRLILEPMKQLSVL